MLSSYDYSYLHAWVIANQARSSLEVYREGSGYDLVVQG